MVSGRVWWGLVWYDWSGLVGFGGVWWGLLGVWGGLVGFGGGSPNALVSM